MIKKILLPAMLFLLFVPCLVLALLVFSSAGLRIGLDLAGRMIPGQLKADVVSGRLVDGFTLEEFRYDSDEAAVTIDRLTFSWKPAALLTRTLSIRLLDISGMHVAIVKSGEPAADAREKTSAPFIFPSFAVEVEKASLNAMKITLPGRPGPLVFDSLVLEESTGGSDRIQLGRLNVTAPLYSVGLQGWVEAGDVVSARLAVDYSLRPVGYGVIEGRGVLTGSPAEIEITADLQQPFSGRLQGSVTDPLGEARWRASLHTATAFLPDINGNWPQFSFTSFNAGGSGTPSAYSLHIETDTEYKDFTGMHLETDIQGDAGSLQFSEAVLSKSGGQLRGRGKLDWRSVFTWQADLSGKHLNLMEVHPGWPAFSIPEFVLSGEGRQAGYAIRLQAEAQHEQVRGIFQVTTAISGDAGGMRLTDTVIRQGGGTLTGEAGLDWRDVFSWQADFSGKGINPEIMDPRLQGNLALRFRTEGGLPDTGLKGFFHLVSLTGELRGYSLAARGNAVIDGKTATLDNFHLEMPGTEIAASGDIGEMLDLNFQVDSSDLTVLWPELAGTLKAEGTFAGKREQPAVRLSFAAERLSVFGTGIERLDGRIATDFTLGGIMDGSVQASHITLADRTIQFMNTVLHGTVADHALRVEVAGDGMEVTFGLQGGMSEEAWTAELSEVEVHEENYGSWRLQKPGKVEISGRAMLLGRFCLAGSDDAVICLAGRQDPASGWQAESAVKALPLSLIRKFLGMPQLQSIRGTMSGNMALAGTRSDILSGEIALATDGASMLLALSADEKYELVWRENSLQAEFRDNRLTGHARSILQDESVVAASVTVDNFSPVARDRDQMKIQGDIHLNIRELNPLSALTFPLAEPHGSLAGNVTLGGSVARPLVHGQIEVLDGKVILPRLGITVENLRIGFDGSELPLRLHLSGSSGGGTLQAVGELSAGIGDVHTLELTVSGNEFEIVNLPELMLYVTPQLELQISRREGRAKGSLHITDGIIAPASLAGSVSPSRDVVFRKARDGVEQDIWPLSADVQLTVDPEVRVDAFGLKGGIAGKIQITDLPGKIVTGIGNLDVVEGTFAIYGRELQIKKGQLLFNGGPVDNPGISVRAENTTKGITTGIAVSGFLREPEITFYSDPPMEENEIIARLLMNTKLVGSAGKDSGFIGSVTAGTGLDPLSSTLSDVKNTLHVDDVRVETGKTSEDLSLVIGTWLTPSLYISYGKNLLKESGSFNTRYMLGHGFSIETESGATESGADLKYEIER